MQKKRFFTAPAHNATRGPPTLQSHPRPSAPFQRRLHCHALQSGSSRLLRTMQPEDLPLCNRIHAPRHLRRSRLGIQLSIICAIYPLFLWRFSWTSLHLKSNIMNLVHPSVAQSSQNFCRRYGWMRKAYIHPSMALQVWYTGVGTGTRLVPSAQKRFQRGQFQKHLSHSPACSSCSACCCANAS